MNKLEELITRLYDEKLKNIAEAKADGGLLSRFTDYINDKYGMFAEELKNHPEISEAMFDDWYQTELRHWGDLSDDDKYAQFTADKVFLLIDEYSSKICNIACKKYERGTVDSLETGAAKGYLYDIVRLAPEVSKENENTD